MYDQGKCLFRNLAAALQIPFCAFWIFPETTKVLGAGGPVSFFNDLIIHTWSTEHSAWHTGSTLHISWTYAMPPSLNPSEEMRSQHAEASAPWLRRGRETEPPQAQQSAGQHSTPGNLHWVLAGWLHAEGLSSQQFQVYVAGVGLAGPLWGGCAPTTFPSRRGVSSLLGSSTAPDPGRRALLLPRVSCPRPRNLLLKLLWRPVLVSSLSHLPADRPWSSKLWQLGSLNWGIHICECECVCVCVCAHEVPPTGRWSWRCSEKAPGWVTAPKSNAVTMTVSLSG